MALPSSAFPASNTPPVDVPDPNYDDNGNPLTADSNAPQQLATAYIQLRAEMETSTFGAPQIYTNQLYCLIGTNDWLMCGDFVTGREMVYRFTGSELIEQFVGAGLGSPAQTGPWNDYVYTWEQGPNGQSWFRTAGPSIDGNPGRPPRQSDRMTSAARIAWLAFCSGPALRNPEHKLYPPNDLWKELVWAKSFRDETVLLTNKFTIPKQVDLLTDDRQPVVQYRVVMSTNLLGWMFPLEFQLAQYRPIWNPEKHMYGSNHWELSGLARGRVTSIGPAKATPAELEARRVATNRGLRQLISEPLWPQIEKAVREKVRDQEGFTSSLARGYILPIMHQQGTWAITVSDRYPLSCLEKPDCLMVTVSDNASILTYGARAKAPMSLTD